VKYCDCLAAGFGKGPQCRASQGFSDDWCDCWCHFDDEEDGGAARYGRREISAWFDGYLERSKGLVELDKLTSKSLFMLVLYNLGWNWDVMDVGKVMNSSTGEMDAYAGMRAFLEELLSRARKQ